MDASASFDGGEAPPPEPQGLVWNPEAEVLWVETLHDTAAHWVAGLSLEERLIQDADALWLMRPESTLAVNGDAAAETDVWVGAARIFQTDGRGDEPVDLIFGSDAVFVLQDGALTPSPLGDLLTDLRQVSITSDGASLWLATSDGLARWSDGSLQWALPEQLGLANALMACGPDALWLATESELYSLKWEEGALLAQLQPDAGSAKALAVDRRSRVWLLEAGAVRERTDTGSWLELGLPEPIAGLWAHPEAEGLWLLTEGGALYHGAADDLRPTEGAPQATAFDALADGTLLAAGPEGVHRIHPARGVAFGGLSSGGVIADPMTITLQPALPEQVGSLTATLDSDTVEVGEGPWSLSLEPADMDEGDHLIEVAVIYDDGHPDVHASFTFRVSHTTVSWSEDIQPLAEDRCAGCHGPNGPIALKLFTMEQWIAESERIMVALQSQLMPLGDPLDPEMIDAVLLWRDLGFPP